MPRSVLYLRKHSPSQFSSPLFAEIAPLPGFSAETPESILEILKSKPMQEPLPPSLAWGLENFISANDFLPSNAYQEWSWLIPRGEPTAQIALLKKLIEKNVRTVKIKTEQESLALLLETLAQVELPDSFKIRLDANNEFSPAAIATLRKFAKKFTIEFVEDPFPLSDIDLWRELGSHLALATNAISTLGSLKKFYLDRQITFLSLKPTLVGDEKRIIELSRELKSYGLKILYSSLMETDLGTLAIKNLCARCPSDAKPGLGVNHLFQPGFSYELLLDPQAFDWQVLA